MKNTILLLAFAIFGLTGQAQNSGKSFDQFSVEAAYGLSVPLNYVSSKLSDGNYTSTSHIDLGVRYMFNSQWGVKGAAAFDNYNEKDNDDFGVKATRFNLEAVYNLGRVMGLVNSSNESVGLLAHSGFGITTNKSLYNDTTEHTGNYILGLTPIFRITDGFSLTADASYLYNYKQHFTFDGVPFANPGVDYESTSLFSFTVGAVFYIGGQTKHADWY
jgi:OOP family OmpA-OmpF porin